jgi:hypothetical protein
MNNWYFITDDTLNKKNHSLFEYLDKQSKNKLVLLTPDYCSENILGYPQEYFEVKDNKKYNSIWAKLTFLFAKISNSSSDIYFPKRNIYNNFIYLNKLLHFFWYLKRIINKYLPNYEYLFFRGIKNLNYKLKLSPSSFFIYDSILLRHVNYASLIKYLRNENVILYSVISSWDNPFYTQLSISAKKYFIWSEQMLNDIASVHNLSIPQSRIELIGPYPFFDFYKSRKNHKVIGNHSKFIGFACAFCDVIFLQHEIQLIKKIASIASHLGFEILVRPYPSLPISEYDELKSIKNVTLYIPKDAAYEDRYGDGRELILFSSNEERHEYLAQCVLFLSTGTSFTIEAAIDNLPIIQIYLDTEFRKESFEKDLFGRVEISDHILKYFNNNLDLINSYENLQLALETFRNSEAYAIELQTGNKKLLSALGFNNIGL